MSRLLRLLRRLFVGFPERAVETCRRDWLLEKVDESHIRDVMKSKKVDVSTLEEFMGRDRPVSVRLAAARVIADKGDISLVVKMALEEQDRDSIFELLRLLGKSGNGLDALEGLVSSEDTMVRDAAVDMFRRAGKVDSLFVLIFNEDDKVVQRIKRYINEAG
jgi:hypothetical protein